MSANKFTDEFKRDAVAQVEDRGYPVREVAERLGVSTKSIYTWQKQFSRLAKVIQEVDAQADEIRRLARLPILHLERKAAQTGRELSSSGSLRVSPVCLPN
jgi:transposase